MPGKKSLTTDADVKAEVDSLLGAFGIVGEAEADFADDAPPSLKSGDRSTPAPSADADALWGGKKKK